MYAEHWMKARATCAQLRFFRDAESSRTYTDAGRRIFTQKMSLFKYPEHQIGERLPAIIRCRHPTRKLNPTLFNRLLDLGFLAKPKFPGCAAATH